MNCQNSIPSDNFENLVTCKNNAEVMFLFSREDDTNKAQMKLCVLCSKSVRNIQAALFDRTKVLARSIPITCEWFALCENLATQNVPHPILGEVPTCNRCADKASS